MTDEKMYERLEFISEQLDEAKDIIKDLLYYLGSCTCDRSNYAELDNDIKRAKEFIKE